MNQLHDCRYLPKLYIPRLDMHFNISNISEFGTLFLEREHRNPYLWFMTHTFHIDGSSEEAQALLAFLRTLEFVNEDKNDYVLTEEHLAILEERRDNRMGGKSQTYSWNEVKDSLGKRKAG